MWISVSMLPTKELKDFCAKTEIGVFIIFLLFQSKNNDTYEVKEV